MTIAENEIEITPSGSDLHWPSAGRSDVITRSHVQQAGRLNQ